MKAYRVWFGIKRDLPGLHTAALNVVSIRAARKKACSDRQASEVTEGASVALATRQPLSFHGAHGTDSCLKRVWRLYLDYLQSIVITVLFSVYRLVRETGLLAWSCNVNLYTLKLLDTDSSPAVFCSTPFNATCVCMCLTRLWPHYFWLGNGSHVARNALLIWVNVSLGL